MGVRLLSDPLMQVDLFRDGLGFCGKVGSHLLREIGKPDWLSGAYKVDRPAFSGPFVKLSEKSRMISAVPHHQHDLAGFRFSAAQCRRQRSADRYLHPFDVLWQTASGEKRFPDVGTGDGIDHYNRPGRATFSLNTEKSTKKDRKGCHFGQGGLELPIQRE